VPPPIDLAERFLLVVEDQFLIAKDLEEMLLTLGARKVKLEMNIGAALISLQDEQPDIALLDYKLGAGTVEPLADALQARNIPFIFITGYNDSQAITARFRNVPLVRKPIDFDSVSAALRAALAGV